MGQTTSTIALTLAEARIGLRGMGIRLTALFAAILGWSVGNAGGSGAGLSALAVGDTACTYLVFLAVFRLALTAVRDTAVGSAAVVWSKPQPTERLLMARFLGAFGQVLILLAAMFAGAALSRLAHSGTAAGMEAYGFQFVRAALVLGFASAAAYSLTLLADTPLAGALVGLYWIVSMAGQEFLAKAYYPYYTQNLTAFALAGVFLIALAARFHRRGRRGDAPPALWCRLVPPLALAAAAWAAWVGVRDGHDPMMRESPLMAEVGRQDASMRYVAPGFLLPDQTGRQVSLADTPGRVFLIALLDPHTEEGALLLGRLRGIHEAYGRLGVLPVAVCVSNDMGAAATLARGEGATFPVLTDWGSHHAPKAVDASPVAGAYRVTDMPFVAVTDRRRRIRDMVEGISTYDGPRLKQAVLERLTEEPQ
jgi:hypothetical protein